MDKKETEKFLDEVAMQDDIIASENLIQLFEKDHKEPNLAEFKKYVSYHDYYFTDTNIAIKMYKEKYSL